MLPIVGELPGTTCWRDEPNTTTVATLTSDAAFAARSPLHFENHPRVRSQSGPLNAPDNRSSGLLQRPARERKLVTQATPILSPHQCSGTTERTFRGGSDA